MPPSASASTQPAKSVRAKETRIGCWCRLESPLAATALARSGLDWLCLDLQHGIAGYDDVLAYAQTLGGTQIDLFVRPPWKDPSGVMKALDIGATGVVVPMIDTAAEVEEVVLAARYPPIGRRSFAGMGRGGSDPHEANRSVMVGAMIETAQALDDLTGILSVRGLDFVVVGPQDLALSCGMAPSEVDGGPFERTLSEIVVACESHGVIPGISCADVASAVAEHARGYRLIAASSDLGLLTQGSVAAVTELRQIAMRAARRDP